MKKLILSLLVCSIILSFFIPFTALADDVKQLYYGNETTLTFQPKSRNKLELNPEGEALIDGSYTVSCDPEIGVIRTFDDGVIYTYYLSVSDRKPGATGKIYAEKDGVKYAIDVKLDYPEEGFYLHSEKTVEDYIVRNADGTYTFPYDANNRTLFFITNGATIEGVISDQKKVSVLLTNDKTTLAISAKSAIKGDETVDINYTLVSNGKSENKFQTILFKNTEPAEEKKEDDKPEEKQEEQLLPIKEYSDVSKEYWAEEAINFVTQHGYFNGYDDGRFGVEDYMSRAMIAVVLYRIAGEPEFSGEKSFVDVSDTAWYAKGVSWAADKGYIKGTGNKLFKPNDNISYQVLCALLHRLSGSPEIKSEEIAGASDWAQSAMKWAVKTGLFESSESGLKPTEYATRSQVANILMKYKKLDNK